MAQPDLIPMPFAENATPGTIEPIPATTPTVPQDATWSTGFPQVTMQPLASGGFPPRGQNFNGVLNALSQHIFHMQSGGQYKWDDAHGPYSIGDVLQSDDGLRAYVSIVNNNTDNFNTNPSAIGASWAPWSGDAKANSNLSVQAGVGLTGGGTLTQNRTLAVQFGTTAGTVMEGNDSRIAGAVPQTRQIIAGAGLSGGGDLSADRTLSVRFASDSEALARTSKDHALTPFGLGFAEQPSMTGSITLNGTTDNTVDLTNIVPELALEIGDVIRINTGAYNKLHTVESITDNSSIVVNYEHAGNRGDGSLKLPDSTGQATVTRIAKWFNAPIGLGQAWVNMGSQRAVNTTYTNTGTKPIFVAISAADSSGDDYVHINGDIALSVADGLNNGSVATTSFIAPSGATYRLVKGNGTFTAWAELR